LLLSPKVEDVQESIRRGLLDPRHSAGHPVQLEDAAFNRRGAVTRVGTLIIAQPPSERSLPGPRFAQQGGLRFQEHGLARRDPGENAAYIPHLLCDFRWDAE